MLLACLLLILWAGSVLVLRLAVLRQSRFLDVNPRYRDLLEAQGLRSPEDYLALPLVVVTGHSDRHVARVTLGAGDHALQAFLKREDRVYWKDRLRNAREGHGLVAKSCREGAVLRALGQVGFRCPEFVAAGEDGKGRAFLLVREVAGAVDLRGFLQERRTAPPAERRALARKLGEELARLHAAGFHHADLYAKHVLVHPGDGAISLIDWQRSRYGSGVSRRQCWGDLAALDASLCEELAGPRERLACLRAYLRCLGEKVSGPWASRATRSGALRQICREAERLLRRPHVRDQRLTRPPAGSQTLVYRGEDVWVTRDYESACQGRTPGWPDLPTLPKHATRRKVALPGGREGTLLCRRASRLLAWLRDRLRRRMPTSPEYEQVRVLFRLQRHGIETPRLLAFGQRHPRPWTAESFLLTEPPSQAEDLWTWLRERSGSPLGDTELGQRRQMFREAGALLRRLHQAGCSLGSARRPAVPEGTLLLRHREGEKGPAVVLGSVEGIRRRRRIGPGRVLRDLAVWQSLLPPDCVTRTDGLRLLLGYLGAERLTPTARKLARQALGAATRQSAARYRLPLSTRISAGRGAGTREPDTPPDCPARPRPGSRSVAHPGSR